MNNQNKNYRYHASFVLKFEHYNLDIVSDFGFRLRREHSVERYSDFHYNRNALAYQIAKSKIVP